MKNETNPEREQKIKSIQEKLELIAKESPEMLNVIQSAIEDIKAGKEPGITEESPKEDKFKNTALLFFAALEGNNQEEIREARINLFFADMEEEPTEEDNTEPDIEKISKELEIPKQAPFFIAYRSFIKGFNAGLKAMQILLEAQDT